YSGHTTIGATHALIEGGRAPGPHVVFDTPAGLVRVEIARDEAGCLMCLEPPLPATRTPTHDVLEVLDAIGLPRAGLANWARPAATSGEDLLLPVTDLAILRALAPDLSRLAALRTAQHARGVFCVSRETVEPTSLTHGRFFAPHYGLPEDIVTGSVHSPLAVWLLGAGVLPAADGRAVFTAEQGDSLGRPGRPQVEIIVRGGQAARVRVGGARSPCCTAASPHEPLRLGAGRRRHRRHVHRSGAPPRRRLAQGQQGLVHPRRPRSRGGPRARAAAARGGRGPGR